MNIWVYGDSFAEANVKCWSSQLAEKLKMPIVNQAIGGSSTEYSFRLFTDNVKNRDFQKGDIIIFVTSIPGRLFFKHHTTDAPREAGMYFHPDCQYDWFSKNKKYVYWYLENIDRSILRLNHEAYVSTIKDAAYQFPDCLFIVLPNSNIEDNFNLTVNPPNFLRSYTSLMEISSREIIGYTSIQFYDAHPEPRSCHLCLPNLKILADLMAKSIKHRDISYVSYDKFQTDLITVIKTKKEYINYVRRDILSWKDWFYERLKG